MAPSKILRFGPWQVPFKATGVMCGDGKRRTARITGPADTYFGIPASIQYRDYTISGFIAPRGYSSDNDLDLGFYPYSYGKNGHMLTSPPSLMD